MPHSTGKSLHFHLNVSKSLGYFEKATNHFQKAPISVQMSSKRIEFFKKASNHLEEISLKSHAFKKIASHSQEKVSWQLLHFHSPSLHITWFLWL
jgi:hypothetical protein